MDAKLYLTSNVLSFSDVNITSNPSQKQIDYSQSFLVEVSNSKTDTYTLAPGEVLNVFNGTRSTSISNTTEFTISLSPLATNRYRFTWTGTGTNPAFRTDRGVALNTETVALTINSNNTATLTASSGNFSSVIAGDVLFIPGTTTGDTAGPFNVQNEGYWSVLSKDGTSAILQLARMGGSFDGTDDPTVTITNNAQVQVFSSAGVQIGDKVNISNGFSNTIKGTYSVYQINPKWFEILTTKALPITETAVPTATGMIFYTMAKRYLRAITDQDCVVAINGNSDTTESLSPWDTGAPGEYVKSGGTTWSLSITNSSSVALNLVILSAE